MMKDTFRKWMGTTPKSLDQIGVMVTRRLPIPELEGSDKYIEFKAKRDKEGFWTIEALHNLKSVTSGLQDVSTAFGLAMKKHTGHDRNNPSSVRMNFDNTLLVLKDMEETLFAYAERTGGKEPRLHYAAAERLLPPQFIEGLETVMKMRTESSGTLLKLKTPSQPMPASPGKKGNDGFIIN